MATQEATKETEAAGLRSGAADPNADGTGAKAAGLFFLMLKIGLFTWGGGWSIVAQMQKDFCEKNRWFTQRELVDYVTLARSLPGILTINISVIVGKSLGGWPLALVAAAGIVLPSVAVLVAVSAFLTAYSGAPLVVKALAGVRAAVVPIVALAGWKMLKASVVDKRTAAILILSFAAAQFTPANKILIIAAGGLAGLALQLGAAWKAKGAGK